MDNQVHFDLPPMYRTFTLFQRLPPELRLRIWRLSLDTPGIQFLQLKDYANEWLYLTLWNDFSYYNVDDSDEEGYYQDSDIALETMQEVRPYRASAIELAPQSSIAQADFSYYNETYRQLTALHGTCIEARTFTQSLMRQRGALLFSRGDRRLISLPESNDLIYLEYMPRAYYRCSYRYSINPDCAGLDKIRRVAVRFCHEWRILVNTSYRCRVCGLFHDEAADKVTPVHLYQFMARHLPNLEEFYFVDFFMIRKGVWPAKRLGKECAGKSR